MVNPFSAPREELPPPEDNFGSYAQDDGYQPSPYDQMPPGMGMPGQTMPYPNQSAQLIQWILNFRREVTTPLKHMWRGEEQDIDGNWVTPDGGLKPVMNDKGISWAISFIESYINPVFITSNFGYDELCWQMRQAGHVAINSIACRYEEFGMKKLDIPRVAVEIYTKIHAVLLGAQNNGYRLWMSSTHHSQEMTSSMPTSDGRSGGIIPSIQNFFTRGR